MTSLDLEQLADKLGSGAIVEHDIALGRRTTYRVGGTGAVAVTLLSYAAARTFASLLPRDLSVAVLGNGSNVVVADEGFSGVVVQLAGEFDAIGVDSTSVTAGGGADLPRVARRSVEEGLAGFEWAVGVPGTVGGAVAMNAGGHGSSVAASLRHATVLSLRTGEVATRTVGEFDFGYRHSNLASDDLVLDATFDLVAGDREAGLAQLREIVAWRREHQPGGQNCGSVFVNPPDGAAGSLIDGCGLRGRRHGTAAVSEKHANFIQADPDGRAKDVMELILEVAREVKQQTGVLLTTELKVLGDHTALFGSTLRSVTP